MNFLKEHLSEQWRKYLALLAAILAVVSASGLIASTSTAGVVLGGALSVLALLGFGAYRRRKEHPLKNKRGW